jgi:hypothetical protein
MSAFMVEDKTINNIVNWLGNEIDHMFIIPRKLKQLNIDTSVPGWAEDLGHIMFLLNINAVDARYGDGEAARFRQLDYRFEHTEAVSSMQVLKSLQCWLYQCCEGEVPETELYKLFAEDIRLFLMDKIITGFPEYEQAEWE